jgi:hypothetical protein
MPMRTRAFEVFFPMHYPVGDAVARPSLSGRVLPLLRRIVQRITIYRCRFCGEFYRQWRYPPLNGVCPDCLRDTLAWLTELGCVVTWPLEDRTWEGRT